jgi:formate dehydrogenase subunit gamma
MMFAANLGRLVRCAAIAAFLCVGALAAAAPAAAQTAGQGIADTTRERPTYGLTNTNEQALLQALKGRVTIPDQKAATLIQPQGRNWRATMEGPVRLVGSWLILGMAAVLVAFFLLRGTIRIENGRSGRAVQRFNMFERLTHWFTASAFIVLALTGLNVTFGRYVLLPLLGPDIFSAVSLAFKYAHNYVAFAFMIGLAVMFVIWIAHNIPNRYDAQWLAAAGGMFSRGTHPPARKFNAGQKLVFWSVVIGGTVLSVTGICMLFPFYFADMEAQQLATVIHSVIALVLIAVILAHIYIGTLGMEGAWDAMNTGQVDENWAREHHSLWHAELKGQPAPKYGHD